MSRVDKIFDLVDVALRGDDVELYDVKDIKAGTHSVLRIFISKADGILIDDCERVSRIVDPLIEESDLFKGRYTLEVSSPGLDRTLTEARHFKTAVGEIVRVRFKSDDEKVVTEKGVLKSSDEEFIVIKVDDGDKNIPLTSVLSGKIVMC